MIMKKSRYMNLMMIILEKVAYSFEIKSTSSPGKKGPSLSTMQRLLNQKER